MARIRIVYGPPGAGKTTHVEQHRSPTEPVIDLDAIAVAMGSPDSHDHPRDIRDLAGAARASALRKSIDRGIDAWVIDTFLRARIFNEEPHRFEFILIDPGVHVTTSRARAAGRPDTSLQLIDRWYRNPPQPPGVAQPPPAAEIDTGSTVADWW